MAALAYVEVVHPPIWLMVLAAALFALVVLGSVCGLVLAIDAVARERRNEKVCGMCGQRRSD